MKSYIPELSEQRMVSRAPNRPTAFGSDAEYVFTSLRAVEQSFGINAFPGLTDQQIPARGLIQQLIVWWRTLEPATNDQREAYGRLPGVIRLIDTFSTWYEDRSRAQR